jgi:ferredoxin
MRRRKEKKVKKKMTIDRYRCAYCGACIAVCKYDANELIETFLIINGEKCNACLTCVKTCPMGALDVQEVA